MNASFQNRSGYQAQNYGFAGQVPSGYGYRNQNINFNSSGNNVYQPYW